MESKIEAFKKQYIEQTKRDSSKIYAQMGAIGVSPKHLKLYEELVNKFSSQNS
jgi:hypothetical protein